MNIEINNKQIECTINTHGYVDSKTFIIEVKNLSLDDLIYLIDWEKEHEISGKTRNLQHYDESFKNDIWTLYQSFPIVCDRDGIVLIKCVNFDIPLKHV
jgi:hypothetical protein